MLDEEEDRKQGLMSRLIVACSTGNNVEVLEHLPVCHKGKHLLGL